MTNDKSKERAHNIALIDAILTDLRNAMIEMYGADRVIVNARSPGGHEVSGTEILNATGETLRVKLSIELTGGRQ